MDATLKDGLLSITFHGDASAVIPEWMSLDGASFGGSTQTQHHSEPHHQASGSGVSAAPAVKLRIVDVTGAEFKDASLVGKGWIAVHSHGTVAHFHFRRKSRNECRALYEELLRQSGVDEPDGLTARLNAFGSEDRTIARGQIATQGSEGPMQFEGLFLNGEDFSGRSLIGANFREAQLCGCNFAQADLTGAVFVDAELERANLAGCELVGADLSSAVLTDAEFSGANLAGAKLDGIIASLVGMAGANLAGASLVGACVEAGDFTSADLQGASLLDAEIEGADFVDANLSGATMPDGTIHE
jgi:uncharacterized protein YjbI with pentapeptide repeats